PRAERAYYKDRVRGGGCRVQPAAPRRCTPHPGVVVRRYHHYYSGVLTQSMQRLALILAFPAALAAQSPEAWQIITPPQASVVFARDGTMIGEMGAESRLSVPLRT